MQKKFGIVVVAAIQGPGHKQPGRPGVSKSSRPRISVPQPAQVAAA